MNRAAEAPSNPSSASAPSSAVAAPGNVAPEPAAADSCAPNEPQVIGLCLGMTRPQAEAALRRYAADIDIEDNTIFFRYNDGVQQQNAPSFLYQLIGRARALGSTVTITFSPLPGESQVVGIDLIQNAGAKLPTVDAYLEDRVATFGPPAARGIDPGFGIAYQGNVRWSYPEGGTACGQVPAGALNGIANIEARPGSNIANELARIGFPDPSQCATVLQFYMTAPSQSDPISMMRAELIDIGAAATAERAMFEWLQRLEADARASRQ